MLVNQVLLALSACALGGACLRVAGRIADGGLVEEVLVAAVLAGAFAVCWTLALGLFGLSGQSVALAAGPVVAWIPARLLIERPQSLGSRLKRAWVGWSRPQRATALGLAGLAAGCALEVALEPGLDSDALFYHLADVVGWIHSGHAGSVQTFSYDLPYGYYPVSTEVMLTWVLGISRSFAPVAIWSSAAFGLTLLALWRVMDVLRVPRTVAATAVIAYGTLPFMVLGLNMYAPGTDTPALMWLLCAAALCARAPARTALLGPALLAVGLGGGTKTTVLPLGVVALAAAAWVGRRRLRPARWWLAGGVVGAILVGGVWYLRDGFVHGWPLWPFTSGPTGDPVPPLFRQFKASFLDRPRATLRVLGTLYVIWLAGGLCLIGGVPLAALAARTRAALAMAAVALAALLVWASAPYTGLSTVPSLEIAAAGDARYMLAALAACTVAIALALRDVRAFWRWLGILLFVGAAIWSLVEDLRLGYPWTPRLQYLIAGGVAGAAIGALAPRTPPSVLPRLAGAATAALAVAFLALSAPGWLGRQSEHNSFDRSVLALMLRQPGFLSGRQPVSLAPDVLASLAGPKLQHPIELIPLKEPCAKVRARARRGWVVILTGQPLEGLLRSGDAYSCMKSQRGIYAPGEAIVYGPSN